MSSWRDWPFEPGRVMAAVSARELSADGLSACNWLPIRFNRSVMGPRLATQSSTHYRILLVSGREGVGLGLQIELLLGVWQRTALSGCESLDLVDWWSAESGELTFNTAEATDCLLCLDLRL